MIPQILVQFPYDSYYTMLLTDNTGFGAGKYDARTESKRSDGSMAGSRLRVVLLLLTHVGGVALSNFSSSMYRVPQRNVTGIFDSHGMVQPTRVLITPR
jgi:hypothetical protein